MPITVACLADIHYADSCPIPARQGAYGDILLRRAINRLNDLIKPDVVVVLGDCLDAPTAADAKERLLRLKELLDLLKAPVVVLPGNHDPAPDVFYSVMERPPEVLDIGRLRLLAFVDPERPEYDAERLPADLERMRQAWANHDGPVLALQHVPVLPPGTTPCPHGYVNNAEIISAMAENHITAAVAGHYHPGTELIQHQGCHYIAVKALCEDPFPITLLTIDGDTVQASAHWLRLPPQLRLVDSHVHTQFAYCNRDMDMQLSCELADLFGLEGLVCTEHSGQLYFARRNYWAADFCPDGMDGAEPANDRSELYWKAARSISCPRALFGLEVDADYHGRPVMSANDRAQADFLVGSVHYLPENKKQLVDPARLADEFLAVMAEFVPRGFDVLAHPFRPFAKAKVEVPEDIMVQVVNMLLENGVAAEVNFNNTVLPAQFVQMCLERGVKLALGSDAHYACQVGDLARHLHLLREECGYDGDLRDVLINPFSS